MIEKRDILEFPLEELEVPAAIVLMMQAATKAVSGSCDEQENVYLETDTDRLQLLAEKLEARVEDAIDAAKSVREESVEEDEPNKFQPVDGHDIHLVVADGLVRQVSVDGVLFVLMCNERVWTDPDDLSLTTTCIKQFGHQTEHTDMEGNYR